MYTYNILVILRSTSVSAKQDSHKKSQNLVKTVIGGAVVAYVTWFEVSGSNPDSA